MRIIAGTCRGRILKAVKGQKTRPTADRVKEAIFNVLAHRVEGTNFLDLFGGTGNIGLEALSRGARQVAFVEKYSGALKVLKANVNECGFTDNVHIFPVDAFKAIEIFKEKNYRFNIIFLDPPYEFKFLEELIARVVDNELLLEQGIVVVETDKNTNLPTSFKNLIKVRENVYGDTKITYFQIE